MSNYPSFPSIERMENLYCVITEKIDGTNSLIQLQNDIISQSTSWLSGCGKCQIECDIVEKEDDSSTILDIKFGSRNRWITKEDDNAGFANVFSKYKDELQALYHKLKDSGNQNGGFTVQEDQIRIYGEWFGKGIQRNYNMDRKMFMPFSSFLAEAMLEVGFFNVVSPAVLYKGKFHQGHIDHAIHLLKTQGSVVVPNYMNPEGIVIHWPTYNMRAKIIIESEVPKKKEKTEHDIQPNVVPCPACSKKMYLDKKDNTMKCRNYHCEQNPDYIKRGNS